MLNQSLRVALQKIIPGLLCLLLAAFPAISQLSVGSSGALFITNGTTFSVDSLVLIPSADLTLSNNSIVKVTTPLGSTTPGITSLGRVYNIGTPFTFSGTVGLIYLDSEIGGNTENQLQIAFNQTSGGTWTTTATSSVNTATNYVSYIASSLVIANISATTLGVVLPITYSNLSAQLNSQFILVSWEAASTTALAGFNVESSADGRTWKKAGYVPAVQGESSYGFKDTDLNFSIRYYRIALMDITGETAYTKVIAVRNPAAPFTLRIAFNSSNGTINFLNATPDGIQLYDVSGRLLKKIDAAQSSYTVGDIPAGSYILYFKVGAEKYVRKLFFQ